MFLVDRSLPIHNSSRFRNGGPVHFRRANASLHAGIQSICSFSNSTIYLFKFLFIYSFVGSCLQFIILTLRLQSSFIPICHLLRQSPIFSLTSTSSNHGLPHGKLKYLTPNALFLKSAATHTTRPTPFPTKL